MNKTHIKVRLADIRPNPFKKEIDGGAINEEQVARLVEGYKQTTFHENLLARKVGDTYQLVYGHHRLEAAKRVYGKDHVINLLVVDYSDEQMVIDLCRENLTHRSTEWIPLRDSCLLAQRWLEGTVSSASRSVTQKPHTRTDQGIGARQIAEFLSKEGKTVSHNTVAKILAIEEKLAPDLREKISKGHAKKTAGEELGVEEAYVLSKIPDKKEQKQVAKLVEDYPGRHDIAIQQYVNAPEPVKEKVLSGKVKIEDIPIAVKQYEFKEKAQEPEEEETAVLTEKELIEDVQESMRRFRLAGDEVEYKLDVLRRKGFSWFSEDGRGRYDKILETALDWVARYEEKLNSVKEKLEEAR